MTFQVTLINSEYHIYINLVANFSNLISIVDIKLSKRRVETRATPRLEISCDIK